MIAIGVGGLWVIIVMLFLNAVLIFYILKLNRVNKDFPLGSLLILFCLITAQFIVIGINDGFLDGFGYFFVYLSAIRLFQFFFEEGRRPRRIITPTVFYSLTIIFLTLTYFLVKPKEKIMNPLFEEQITKAMDLRYIEYVGNVSESSMIKIEDKIIAGGHDENTGSTFFYFWNQKGKSVSQKIYANKTFQIERINYRNDTIYSKSSYGSKIDRISISNSKNSPFEFRFSKFPLNIETLNFYKDKSIISWRYVSKDTISILGMNNKKIVSFSGFPLNTIFSGNLLFATYKNNGSDISCYNLDELKLKWSIKLNTRVFEPRYIQVLLSPENVTSTDKYIALPTTTGITIIRKKNGHVVNNYEWKEQHSSIPPKHKLIGNFLYYNFGNDILFVDVETSEIKRRYKNAFLQGVYNNKIVATSLDRQYYLVKDMRTDKLTRILTSDYGDELSIYDDFVIVNRKSLYK